MRNLLCGTLLIAFATVALSDCAEMDDQLKECLEEYHMDADIVKKFKSFRHDENIDNVSEDMKCLAKCVLEKEGILKAGAVNEEVLSKRMKGLVIYKDHSAEAEEAVEDCKKMKGDTDCETAFKLVLCHKKHRAQVMG